MFVLIQIISYSTRMVAQAPTHMSLLYLRTTQWPSDNKHSFSKSLLTHQQLLRVTTTTITTWAHRNKRVFTSNLGVVCHSNPTFIVVRLHGDFPSTPGPVPEKKQHIKRINWKKNPLVFFLHLKIANATLLFFFYHIATFSRNFPFELFHLPSLCQRMQHELKRGHKVVWSSSFCLRNVMLGYWLSRHLAKNFAKLRADLFRFKNWKECHVSAHHLLVFIGGVISGEGVWVIVVEVIAGCCVL